MSPPESRQLEVCRDTCRHWCILHPVSRPLCEVNEGLVRKEDYRYIRRLKAVRPQVLILWLTNISVRQKSSWPHCQESRYQLQTLLSLSTQQYRLSVRWTTSALTDAKEENALRAPAQTQIQLISHTRLGSSWYTETHTEALWNPAW